MQHFIFLGAKIPPNICVKTPNTCRTYIGYWGSCVVSMVYSAHSCYITRFSCKKGTNDRLVFGASRPIKFYSVCCNMMTTSSLEPSIEYGDAFQRFLNYIYNQRINHKDEDILIYSDDVSGAFRWSRLNPFIAAVFSFLFYGTLYVPVGQVFGGNTSAQNFEPVAKSRVILSKHIFL